MNREHFSTPLRQLAACALAGVAIVLAAPPAFGIVHGWDDLLERDDLGDPGAYCQSDGRTPNTTPKGWGASDGGFTVRHASTNRSFWFFGDTWAPDAVTVPAGSGLSAFYWKPNTMLMSTSSGGAVPTSFAFYGRNTSNGPNNMTTHADGFARPWMPLGWTGGRVWYWPGKSIIPPNSNSMYSYWERIGCTDVTTLYPSCRKDGDTSTGVPFDLRGFAMMCKFSDITGSPVNWGTPSCSNLSFNPTSPNVFEAPLDYGFVWGRAVAPAPNNNFYIYGYTKADDGFPDRVIVARATEGNLQTYTNWEFYKATSNPNVGQWLTGPPTQVDEMFTVATGADTYFTVDPITVNTTTAWLMTQGWGAFNMHLVIRRSDSNPPGLHFRDLNLTSDFWNVVKVLNGPGGIDPACQDSPAFTYHKTAQWDLSDQASKKLLVSYYCSLVDHRTDPGSTVTPIDCNLFNSNAWVRGCTDPQDIFSCARGSNVLVMPGRIRFYNQDLTKLHPWCSSNCDQP